MRINALPKGTSTSTWFRTRVTGLQDHCSIDWTIAPPQMSNNNFPKSFQNHIYHFPDWSSCLLYGCECILEGCRCPGCVNQRASDPRGAEHAAMVTKRDTRWLSGMVYLEWFTIHLKLDIFCCVNVRCGRLGDTGHEISKPAWEK